MSKEEVTKVLEQIGKEMQEKLEKDGIMYGDELLKIFEKYGIVSNSMIEHNPYAHQYGVIVPNYKDYWEFIPR